MGMVSGFFNTSSFGKAVGSVGEDWAQFSRDMYKSDVAERLAQMREERERRLAELHAELLAERAARGQGLGGSARGSKGGGWNGSGEGGQLTDEEEAARASRYSKGGMTVPDYQSGLRFHKQGPQIEMKAGVDSPGMEYLDPADREEWKRRGGEMRGETEDTMRGRKFAEPVRKGIIERTYGPGFVDDYQKAETERIRRETTIEARTPEERQAGGLGVSAYKGEGPFDESGGTVLNKHTGKHESTAVGKSMEQKNKAAANESNADAAAGGKGASRPGRSDKVHSVAPGGDGMVYIYMEDGSQKPAIGADGKQLTSKEFNETRRKLESELAKNPMYMGERNRDKKLAEIDRQMREIYPATSPTPRPGGSPPINPAAKAGSSNAQSSSAPRYPDGTRLRGKDGKTYVVRGGVPVLEGK